MPSTKSSSEPEDIARQGEAIYQSEVKPKLSANDVNKFVAIDIHSGEYEIAEDELAACDRLQDRLPKAEVWLVRVGSPYVYRFGGGSVRGD